MRDNADRPTEFDRQMTEEYNRNQSEIQQKRRQLSETTLQIQRGQMGQSWSGSQ